MRVALIFPGQGSQAAGMAATVQGLPVVTAMSEVALAEGLDLGAALAGDDEALRPTEIAQPALLLVGVALAGALPGDLEVVGVSGHSVGEYAALVAAGAMTAEAAMRLVIARGRAMAAMHDGTMAALLGADVALAEAVCAEASARGVGPVVVANLNAPGQVVISGSEAAVDAAVELARDRGVRRAVRLRVSGAFHSPLMAGAAEEVGRLVDVAPITDARVPVVCNVDGAAVRDAAGLRERVRRQLASPVRWSDCVATLSAMEPDAVLELGPGGVLSGMVRRIAPGLRAVAVATAEEAAGVGSAAGAHG